MPKTGRPKLKERTIKKCCVTCNRRYIYDRDKKQGHTRSQCNSCRTNRGWEQRKLDLVVLFGGKCTRPGCGYEGCIQALQFHHPDPSAKKFEIGSSYNRNWDELVAEARECVLLCANCHYEAHAFVHGKLKSVPLLIKQGV